MLQFAGQLRSIYSGANTSRTRRWVAADFFDRILFAAPGAPLLFWASGMPSARPVPGLADTSGWDGVEVIDQHVFVWRGEVLKWSDRGDGSSWIPVRESPATGRAVLESDFVRTATGSTSGHAYLSGVAGEFVPGQYVRIVSNQFDPETSAYDYFQVVSASLEAVTSATSISTPQTVGVGETARVYLEEYGTYLPWATGARLRIGGSATKLVVTGRSRDISTSYPLSDASAPIPAVGGTTFLPFGAVPADWKPGDVISVGLLDASGQDLYRVQVVSYSTQVVRLPIGTRAPGSVFAIGSFAAFQPWVEVTNTGTEPVSVGPGVAVSVVSSLVLTPQGFTGGSSAGDAIPAGSAVETIDANEAGELVNAGAGINGQIWAVVALNDLAYVLKHNSIQSLQIVSPANGIVFLRPEIRTEGLIGRYAWCRGADNEIIFWGRKGFFIYAGGQDLREFGVAHYADVREEFDRSRADEVIAHHRAQDREIWFVYPTLAGATKVLIYNYLENSIVTDNYSADLGGITAVAEVDWELAPTWESLPITEKCNGPAKRWYEYVDEGEKTYTVLGIGGDVGNPDMGEDATKSIPRLLVHGRNFARATNDDCCPQGYQALAETPDFDFGDATVWKYVDTVFVTMDPKPNQDREMKLRIQIGARDNLNSPVRWSAPHDIVTRDAGTLPTKINRTVSGRFIRVRFVSEIAGTNWGISSYRITARRGGTF